MTKFIGIRKLKDVAILPISQSPCYFWFRVSFFGMLQLRLLVMSLAGVWRKGAAGRIWALSWKGSYQ